MIEWSPYRRDLLRDLWKAQKSVAKVRDAMNKELGTSLSWSAVNSALYRFKFRKPT